MSKALRYILAVLLIAALLWLVPSEKVVAEEETGRVIEIPVEQEVMAPINEKYYTSDLSYEDPSLKIELSSGRAFDTDYMVARIKIANGSQIRSALQNKNGTDEAYADKIAKKVNAVLAINGDNFRTNKPRDTLKYIVRQKQNKLVQKWRKENFFDILLIDDEGNLNVLKTPTQEEVEAFVAEHNVINTFCFGPALVVNGEVQPKPDSLRANGVGWGENAQRMALCQTGDKEYMVVVTGGRDNPHCKGVTIDEFIQIILSEGQPETVYNLDGGNSAWLVFKGIKQNTFGRTGRQGYRAIPDIIYFASAWQEGGQ